MPYFPSLEEFMELSRHADLVPVYRQLVGDTLTPVSAFCKIQEGDWSFLCESVIGGERVARYSSLASSPFLRFQAYGTRVHLDGPQGTQELTHPDPIGLLQEKLAACKV